MADDVLARLIDLSPCFVRYLHNGGLGRASDVDEAHGVMFLCPLCFKKNGGSTGTHNIVCWFAGRGVPNDAVPGPGRWVVYGRTWADLTLSPSVHLAGPGSCGWHGWCRSGDLT